MMAIIKRQTKTQKITSVDKIWKNWKEPFVHCCGSVKGAAVVEKSTAVPQNINIELPHDASRYHPNSISEYIPKITESNDVNRYLYTNVHSSVT